jgi:hypothetical protein
MQSNEGSPQFIMASIDSGSESEFNACHRKLHGKIQGSWRKVDWPLCLAAAGQPLILD